MSLLKVIKFTIVILVARAGSREIILVSLQPVLKMLHEWAANDFAQLSYFTCSFTFLHRIKIQIE